MPTKRTPPIDRFGRYELAVPWTADPAKTYTCEAIRSFPDCEERGLNVLEDIYVAMGLTQTEYDADLAVDPNIITLMADDGETIYVPDTYVVSYPNMGDITYSHVVLSASIGPIPDYVPLSLLTANISALCSDVIGIEPEVNVNKAPHAGTVTPDQHEASEAARLQAITIRETWRARALQLEQDLNAANQVIADMSQILIDNGYLV